MRKTTITLCLAALCYFTQGVFTQDEDKGTKQSEESDIPNKNISYKSFLEITKEVEAYRKGRRISVDEFIKFSKEKNTLILDTRSKTNYSIIHIKGAKHLAFTEFDVESLAKIIPNKEIRILIYCNNNFNTTNKALISKKKGASLNIPTFIHLYTYGYKNIYELGPVVDMKKAKLEFVKLE